MMTLCVLDNDALGVILEGLRNPLEPGDAVGLGSVSHRLRALTKALRDQLRADHEVAATLCRKVGMRSCKELREARVVSWHNAGLTTADLTLLLTLAPVLPALEKLSLHGSSEEADPEGTQQLVAGLSTLACIHMFALSLGMHVGDAGALALAAALGRGALPQLRLLSLTRAGIGDAGLVALAPALQYLPALEELYLQGNPFGDEGLAALVALPQLYLQGNPFGDEGLAALVALPQPAGALLLPTGVLTRLKVLYLNNTQVSDAGCAAFASALDSGAMPALWGVYLDGTPASAAAKAAVYEALAYTAALRYTRLPLPGKGSGTLPFGSRRRAPFVAEPSLRAGSTGDWLPSDWPPSLPPPSSLPWRSQSPRPLRPPRQPPAVAPIAAAAPAAHSVPSAPAAPSEPAAPAAAPVVAAPIAYPSMADMISATRSPWCHQSPLPLRLPRLPPAVAPIAADVSAQINYIKDILHFFGLLIIFVAVVYGAFA